MFEIFFWDALIEDEKMEWGWDILILPEHDGKILEDEVTIDAWCGTVLIHMVENELKQATAGTLLERMAWNY